MKTKLITTILTLAISALSLPASSKSAAYDVRDFGARGDGRAIDSPAINRAIQRASSQGGGVVLVPAGQYLCYTIRLESNIELRIEQGATIISAEPDGERGYDLPEESEHTKYQTFGHNHVCNSLIYGRDLVSCSITGGGMIDGSQLKSWQEGERLSANKAIGLKSCCNVRIQDITILRGGHFAIHATDVDNLQIRGLKIDTDRDAMDIVCCRNVTISDCIVNGPQDDAIVFKSNWSLGYLKDVENVSVTGCHISGYKCGTMLDGTFQRYTPQEDQFRSGGRIKFGTESNGGYKNIVVSACTFDYCGGLIIVSEDGGVMEDVSFNNITMRGGLYAPIFIRLGARMRAPEGMEIGTIRRLNISDLTADGVESWNACTITGLPGHYVEDITLRNIHLYYKGGFTAEQGEVTPPEFPLDYPEPWCFGTSPASGFFIRHARNVSFDGIYLSFEQPDGRRPFVETDTEHVYYDNIFVDGIKL